MRFNEILLIVTILTGLIWLVDSLFFRPRRIMLVLPGKRAKDTMEPWWVEYSRAFFPILLIVLILRAFILEPFRIPSGSMRPTLLEGDFILVNKFDYGLRLPFTNTVVIPTGLPKRGDVVVFRHAKNGESLDMIKRVIGLPGDHIQYKDNTVYVNDKPMKQEFSGEKQDKDVSQEQGQQVRAFKETLDDINHDIYVHAGSMPRQYPYQDVTVPPDEYFVMGDNRDNSDDSRFWGFVDNKDLLGKAVIIWFSWDSSPRSFMDCIKYCIRWDRIGNRLSEPVQSSGSAQSLKDGSKGGTAEFPVKGETTQAKPAPATGSKK